MKNKKFSIKPKLWTSWRAEEREVSERILKSLKGISTYKMEKSYFLRDVVVSYLENHPDFTADDVIFVASRLKDITGTNVSRAVVKAFKIWGRKRDDGTLAADEVECYLTPKSLIYTIRKDYKF